MPPPLPLTPDDGVAKHVAFDALVAVPEREPVVGDGYSRYRSRSGSDGRGASEFPRCGHCRWLEEAVLSCWRAGNNWKSSN
jgi:hypothetical protein